MDALRIEVSRLEEFRNKLQQLMPPIPPAPSNGHGNDVGGMAPLAEEIKQLRCRLQSFNEFLAMLEI